MECVWLEGEVFGQGCGRRSSEAVMCWQGGWGTDPACLLARAFIPSVVPSVIPPADLDGIVLWCSWLLKGN